MPTKDNEGGLARQNAAREALRPVKHDCETCGIPHRTKDGHQACVRHKSKARGGAGCKLPPLRGLTTCHMHGGNTHKAIGQRRIAAVKAAAIAARWGLPVDITPVEAVLEQVKASAGHVQFYKLQVEALENAQMIWGQTRNKIGGDDRGATYEAGRNAWLTLYDAERERLVKFCAEAIKAGIEERRVRIAEQQGALVADVIRAILGELGLTEDQQAKIPELVPRHLRMLTGGAA